MPVAAKTFRLPSQQRTRKRDDRASAARRGYGAQWRKLRDEVYARDKGACQMCGAVIAGREAHVDHIVAKRHGGADVPSNLQLLCRSCHSIKTRREVEGDRMAGEGEGGRIAEGCGEMDHTAPVTFLNATPET